MRKTQRIEAAIQELNAISARKMGDDIFNEVCKKHDICPDLVERVFYGKWVMEDNRRRLEQYILRHRTISDIKAARMGISRPQMRFKELYERSGLMVREVVEKRSNGTYRRYLLKGYEGQRTQKAN